MGKKITISAIIPGGKAPTGPPLGPALGPLGVPVGKVVAEINKKTKKYEGMRVPIKVHIDPETKQFEIEVGMPPTSALILQELGKEKGSSLPGREIIGDLTIKQVVKIAKMKLPQMNTKSLKSAVKCVLGTCLSMGVTVNGKNPKIVQREIDEGKIKVE